MGRSQRWLLGCQQLYHALPSMWLLQRQHSEPLLLLYCILPLSLRPLHYICHRHHGMYAWGWRTNWQDGTWSRGIEEERFLCFYCWIEDGLAVGARESEDLPSEDKSIGWRKCWLGTGSWRTSSHNLYTTMNNLQYDEKYWWCGSEPGFEGEG